MNIVIKSRNNYSESLGAIDLTAPDTVLILCKEENISTRIVPILNQIYKSYDLNDAIITICYPEEPWWRMDYFDSPLVGICHLFMEEHDLYPANLVVITGNFLAPDVYRRWRSANNKTDKSSIYLKVHYTHWDLYTYVQKRHNYYATYKNDRYFKYVNLNGANRPHRTDILNYLYDSDFLNLGLNSCHYDDDDLHADLRKRLPLIADHLPPNSHHLDQSHLYNNTYFSIVTESTFKSNDGGITEKTYKTFYYRHPFIMAGSPGTLAILHELGFKTFDGLIDELYDDIINNDERLDAIKIEIHKLCSMSNKELNDWHHSLSNIYDHNQNLLYHWGCTSRRDRPRNDNYN